MANARRPPAEPPELPGFTFERHLGSGGFSDVYLYEQHLPRRHVAVKVLLGGDALGESSRKAFIGEANVMAQMSSHPYILTIFHADVASDGRPFFVMEYAPGRSLSSRYRTERIPIDEVLRTGVNIASAVATAHAAGVLHRDIKPANVLTNAYGAPALTDFGISSAVSDELADAAEGMTSGAGAGMSVPWSSPEMFDDNPQPDVRSEVFSLGATVYTLVAGHTPFEVPGGKNGTIDLIRRIERGDVTPVSRRDAPRALVSVLHKAMSRRPEHRYATAVEFARALQRVELELGYSATNIVVPNLNVEAPVRPAGDADEESTNLRSVPIIDAQGPAVPQRVSARDAGAFPATVHAGARAGSAERTETRGIQRVAAQHGDETASRGRGPQPIDPGGRKAAGVGAGDRAAAVGTTGGATMASRVMTDFEEPSLPPLGGEQRSAFAPVFERQRSDRIEVPDDTGDVPVQRAADGVAQSPAPKRDRARGEQHDPYAEAKKPKNHNLLIGILAGVVVLLLVALSIVGWVLFPRGDAEAGGDGGSAAQPVLPGDYPAKPQGGNVVRSDNGMITFSWTNPDPQDGDVFFWRISGSDQPGQTTTEPEATIGPYPYEANVCIEVETRRAGLVSPEKLQTCWPQ
ncbi:hypothetical protein GCM10011490_13220 [Pseudoclavibacter endophyticus]|uniref:serine/threonine protein kinase n=1 Tax=Pseudoclavibacter endophyticus TaxID=1778590 RepID=UPI0016658C85|nr:serine/threonine-protein kinase [Pseudoclavibacter endophyticus]GGA63941.1 hypothetical protein GCM10011490_13220 [Pseudoclavibacter endophyticus]